ncbi:MAG: adenylate/guanylate cyclase domain-containing protein [Alphaproteobacteria bacterium]
MALDIVEWLDGLGLSDYAEAFVANDIDEGVLADLTADDLKDIGVASVGHRRRLLSAIEKLSAPQPASITAPPEAPVAVTASTRTDAERRQLTVMFVDLVGSTELSGRLDPEDLRALMQRYQATVADVIRANHGYLANWLGDGAITYFGWPNAGEDQALQAVRAGLDAVAAVGRMPLAPGSAEMLAARVGIATGQVVVGELEDGSVGPERTVTGETPNLAARLQGLAAPGGVVIGRTTRALVGAAFEVESLGPQELKGFNAPVEAWAVRAAHESESRFEAPGGRLTAFTGRAHEVGLLLDRWSQARAGEGQVVLVSGEPGIGKSRIVRAFRDRIDADQYRQVLYQCSPYHVNSALYPAIRQLEFAGGFATGATAEARLDRLEGLLRQATPDVAEVVPLIAALLSIPFEARYGVLEIEPQQQRMATMRALQGQLLGLARKEPILFVLEDAHWIDPTTRELIATIVPHLADQRVMMLITHRPEWQDPFQGQGHVTRLNLSRLSRTQIAAIVRDVAGQAVTEEAIARVVERTDGVPLFVEELTKAMAEVGFSLSDDEVPVTLQASLMARLDRLGPAKEIAQIGAVIGREFDRDLLARVADRRIELDAGLDRLIEAQLIFRTRREEGDVFTFKHALIQDIAYDSLLRQRRQTLHIAIAEALTADEGPEAAPEVLARHFERGGNLRQALHWSDIAGSEAAGRSAQPEAMAHCSNAVRLLRAVGPFEDRERLELSLLFRLGQAQFGAVGGGSPETIETFERAGELAAQLHDTDSQIIALYGQYVGQVLTSQLRRALESGKQASAIGKDSGAEWIDVVAVRLTAGAAYLLGELAEARDCLGRLGSVDEMTVRQIPAGFAHDPMTTLQPIFAHVEWATGHREAAFRRMGNAVEAIVDRRTDANSLGFTLTWATLLGAFDRDAARVQAAATLLTDHAQRTGGDFWGYIGEWGRGTALLLQGKATDGLVLIAAGADAFAGTNASQHVPFLRLSQAEALHLCGDSVAALDLLDLALELVKSTGQRFYEPEAHRLRGVVLAAVGRTDEAAAAYRTAVSVADGQGSVIWRDRAAANLAALTGG